MDCQNCGRESHCGKPLTEMMEANKVEVCSYCRCGKCTKTESERLQEELEPIANCPMSDE